MSLDTTSDKPSDDKVLHVVSHSQDRRKGNTDRRLNNDVANAVVQRRDKFNAFAPEEKRENTRGIITVGLVGTFALCMVVIVMVGVYKIYQTEMPIETAIDALKGLGELLGLTLLPVITGVTAFYFATEKR